MACKFGQLTECARVCRVSEFMPCANAHMVASRVLHQPIWGYLLALTNAIFLDTSIRVLPAFACPSGYSPCQRVPMRIFWNMFHDQPLDFFPRATAILHELVLSYSDNLRYVKGVASALKWSSAKSENTEIYFRGFQFVAHREGYLKCLLMGMGAVEAKYALVGSVFILPLPPKPLSRSVALSSQHIIRWFFQ